MYFAFMCACHMHFYAHRGQNKILDPLQVKLYIGGCKMPCRIGNPIPLL